jgi:hypothetical protein
VDAQVSTQEPPEQSLPAAQTLPHAPQLFGSSVSLAQYVGFTVGQAVKEAEQLSTQALLWQSLPAAQVVPQLPQLLASSTRFAQ